MSRNIDLLNGAVLPTLGRFAAPFMLTAAVQMAYGLTDMMWIGRLDSNAVAAVGIIGFLTWIGDAVAIIARTGMGVLVAQSYGEGDRRRTIAVMNEGFRISLFYAALYVALTQATLSAFIAFYRLGPEVSGYASDYGRIVLAGLLAKMVNFTFSQAYQSLGDSGLPFRINAIGLAANMVLDPVLIFGFGAVPALGIVGAAWATVLAQVAVTVIFIRSFGRQGGIFDGVRFFRRPDLRIWREISALGAPVALLNAAHASVSVVLSRFISNFGALAVAVTSVGTQIESISWMSVEGFSGAITAMVAQNYGASRYGRVREAVWKGLGLATGIGLAAMAVMMLLRTPLFGIFLPGDVQGIALGGTYLLILGLSQPFQALEMGAAANFNGLGETRIPSLISITLNVARIPIALLLMPSIGVYGLWWAMSLSSILKGVCAWLALGPYVRRRAGDLDTAG